MKTAELRTKLLASFLKFTSEQNLRLEALRLLTLHMLESYAPKFFKEKDLAGELKRLIAANDQRQFCFEKELTPDEGMAAIDICYVLHHRGLKFQLQVDQLKSYIEQLAAGGDLIYAWLIAELAYQCNIDVRFPCTMRPYKDHSRFHDLYWVTHQVLLATRYLHRRPLPKVGWESRVQELKAAVGWISEHEYFDLGAEIAICLQLAEQQKSREYQQLIDLLRSNIDNDGIIVDPNFDYRDETIAHCIAANLVAFSH